MNELVENKRKTLVEQFVSAIESNPLQWERGWFSPSAWAHNAKTQKDYKGVNALFLAMAGLSKGYTDSRWVTFNQAKDLGASVKAGEKSTAIMFWSQYDKLTKRQFNPVDFEDKSEDDRIAYLNNNVRPVLKFYNVFNAEQCSNFPENTRSNEMTMEELQKQNEKIESIITNSEAPIHFSSENRAYYSISSDSIHLPEIKTFKSMQNYYATALHEIAHSTGHYTRLNRFTKENYPLEELRAELASTFLQIEHGIVLEGKHFENHAAYLQAWLAHLKKDPLEFYRAAADAERIAEYISQKFIKKHKQNTEESNSNQTDSKISDVLDLMHNFPEMTLGEAAEELGRRDYIGLSFPISQKVGDYEKTVLIRLPQGEYSHFVFYAPKNCLKEENAKITITVDENYKFTLKNDGREVKLNASELRAVLEGKQIGKSAQRVQASKRSVERLDALAKNIPNEMQTLPNWCVYRTKWNPEKEKKDKFILNPADGKWAKSTDPTTWTDFESALKYAKDNGCDGLAFALNGNGISCIDLDKCIDANKELNETAKRLTSEISTSYTEISTSGNGIHIFVKDDITARGKYKNRAIVSDGEIEVYDKGRFISMTGNLHGDSRELKTCPTATLSNLRSTLGQRAAEQERTVNPTYRSGSDDAVIERIRASKKGVQFDELYRGGDITGDKSRNDFMMLNMLAFFTDCDTMQMERIFKSSGLFRPDKGQPYLSRSIDKACNTLTNRIGMGAGKSKAPSGCK